MPDGGPSIAEVIGEMRRQLEQAKTDGERSSLRFDVGSAEVTLTVGVDKTNGVGGGLKIWVLEAGAKRDSTNTATQTVTVTLSPYEVAPDGSHVPVDVATAAWPTRRNLMPGAAFDRLVEVWAADDRDDGYCGRTYVTPVGLSAPAGSACGADQSVCVPAGLASA